MTTKKKALIIFSIVLIAVLTYGVKFGLSYAHIATSYAAKTVCSDFFISGRDFKSIKAEDLYAVSFVNIEVDEKNHSVTSDIYGLAKAKAIYREGYGSTLVNSEEDENELREEAPLKFTTKSLDTNDLPQSNIPSNIDSAKLFQTIDEYFVEKQGVKPRHTRAIVILYDGKIIAEKYAPGITAKMPLLGWSMSKSVTNAMIGILVKDKKLDIYKPTLVEEWQNDERKNITLDELLRMSSGLAFEEDYGKPSDATQMLFQEKNCGKYAMGSKLSSAPNSVFQYSSGTSNILQEIIRRQFVKHEDYLAFPYDRLFRKIGMESVVFEPDASGTYVGSSFMYATARDWAEFGQLYLQDGIWKGERILPEGWAKYSGTESPTSKGVYAAQFWINHNDKEFPQDAFYADGFEGQFVTIIPSLKMVIVRLGCTQKPPTFNNVDFVKDIIKAIKQ